MRQKSSDARHPTITTVQERVDHHQQVDCLPLQSQRPRNAIVDPIATRTAPSSTHRRNPSVATWLLQRHRRPNIATPASLHHRRTTPIVAQRLLHSMRMTAVAAADEKMNMENAESASAVPLPKRTMFEQFSVQPNNNSSASQPQHSTSQPENQDQDCDYPIGTKLVKYFRNKAHGKFLRFNGVVYDYKYLASEKLYMIRYEDDDEEDLSALEMAQFVVTPATKRVPRTPQIPNTDCLFELHGLAEAAAQQIHCFPEEYRTKVAEFFLFVSERQRVWERRNRGDAPPWSACYLFVYYSWCNNYRELDRGTAFFREHILALKQENLHATKSFLLRRILFYSYLYRQCNRVETFLRTGFPSETKPGLTSFFAELEKISAEGERVFTGAYRIPDIGRYQEFVNGSTTKGRGGQSLLDRVCGEIIAAEGNVRLILKALQKLKGIGEFLCWQVLCDLQEAQCVDTRGDDYCILGPGAELGLEAIFPESNVPPLDLAQQLVKHHGQVYNDLKVEFPFWRGRPLTIKEIEHALCEFSKFSRLTNPPKDSKPTKVRVYRSRADLDRDKPCFQCDIVCDDGHFCDTCNTFYCTECVQPCLESASWICGRCEAMEE